MTTPRPKPSFSASLKTLAVAAAVLSSCWAGASRSEASTPSAAGRIGAGKAGARTAMSARNLDLRRKPGSAGSNITTPVPTVRRKGRDVLTHTVQPGQNLYRIALQYGVNVEDLRSLNRLGVSSQVRAGRVLALPSKSSTHGPSGVTHPAPAAEPRSTIATLAPALVTGPSAKARASFPAPAFAASGPASVWKGSAASPGPARSGVPAAGKGSPAALSASLVSLPRASSRGRSRTNLPSLKTLGDAAESTLSTDLPLESASDSLDELPGPDEEHLRVSYTLIPSADPFSWPVDDGILRSPFGNRHGRLHAGVDISAPTGSPVHATRDGSVIYSGSKMRGYGNVVMVDHGDGFVSLYAHNSKNLVRLGDRVCRGQTIALVGATGNATGSHCHFEVRRENTAMNPMHYLRPDGPEAPLVARARAPRSVPADPVP